MTANAARVRDRIAAAGGDPDRTVLLAVTKGQPADAVAAALAAGLVDVGENYAGELVDKAAALAKGPRWHFIGQLQRNKVRQLAPFVELWQSIDRLPLGVEVATRSPGAAVLVQVNLTDDPNRGGAPPAEVGVLVGELLDRGLDVRGLMAVAPLGDARSTSTAFGVVRGLADDLGLPERSMGMSGDLELAVAAGSTMVRIGTALFGARTAVGPAAPAGAGRRASTTSDARPRVLDRDVGN